MEGGEPILWPLLDRGWPLNTPANFSSLVHAVTGGHSKELLWGLLIAPVKGGGEAMCQKHGTIRLTHDNWQWETLQHTNSTWSLQNDKHVIKCTNEADNITLFIIIFSLLFSWANIWRLNSKILTRVYKPISATGWCLHKSSSKGLTFQYF